MIQLSSVSRTFAGRSGEVEALRSINLDVADGEFVAVVGRSGCGKSTLLRLIAGLLPPTAGQITVAGVPVTKARRDIAMLFQRPALLPWRSVLDNVLLPVEIFGWRKAKHRARAQELLEMVGLRGFERRHHSLCQGGIRRRECFRHGVPHGVLFHEVGLAAETAAERVACSWDALAAGMRCHIARSVDDGALPDLSSRIAGGQRFQRLLGCVTGLQQLQAERAVAEIDVRLRRHRSDAGERPRHGRTDLEVVRLHGDTELTGLAVTRDDRVGQGALS